MEECFRANIYVCYFPAHTSHGMQPADNGPFKVLKGAYRKHLERLQSLSDADPVGKINFVRCLLRARKEVTPTVIKSAFRHTGIWPISRRKAYSHPKIQKDPEKRIPSDQPVEPVAVTRRQILDLAKEGITTATRRFELKKVADNLDEKNAEIAILKRQLTEFHEKKALEAETTTRRKPVKKPNPNARFIKGSEIWSTNSTIQSLNVELRARKRAKKEPVVVVVEEVVAVESTDDDEEDEPVQQAFSRRGREIRPAQRIMN